MAGESNGVNGWGKFIAQVGVPAAVLLLLLWFLLPVMVKQGEALPRIEQKLDAHVTDSKEAEAQHHDHSNRLEQLMRLLCVNTASTPQDRQNCLTVR